MELKDAIINRRSVKKIEHDTTVSDEIVRSVIETAAYAPNHGMREPWRVIWAKKERLEAVGEAFADIAFKMQPEKYADHVESVKKLSGMLVIAGKRDRRQKENVEDILAIGAFMQNLSLLFYAEGVGTCIKTKPVIWHPNYNAALGVQDDEMIYGLMYLTDSPSQPVKERKNIDLITEY